MISLIGSLLNAGGLAEFTAGGLLALVSITFLCIGVVLGAIDMREHRLPNRILYPWAAMTSLTLALVSFLLADPGAAARAVLAGVSWAGGLWLMRRLIPGSVGFGDVKLVVILGMHTGFLGWEPVLFGVVASAVFAGVAATSAIMLGKATKQTPLPFGPHLLGGSAMALILSPG